MQVVQKTNKGFWVSGIDRAFNPKLNTYDGWSGRVRVVADNPYYDEHCKWDMQGNPRGHDYGALNPNK